MGAIVFLVGALVTALGIYMYLAPESVRPIMAWAITRERIRRIGIFRLVLAVAIYFAAAETRMPAFTIALALITAVAGLSTLLMPFENVEKMVAWWLERSDRLLLPYLLIVLAFGLFLMWLAWPVAT